MLLFTVIALFVLAFCNYVICRRKLFHPPVVLCFVWAGILLLVWLSGDFFYPVSSDTLFIFLLGSAAFSAGGALLATFERKTIPRQISPASNYLLTIAVVLLVLMAPLFYYRVASAAGGYGAPTFLMTARMAMLDLAEKGQDTFFTNVASLSIMVGLMAFNEREHGKLRAAVALLTSFFLNVITGGRSGIVVLVLGCIAVDWIKLRRIRWKFVSTAAAIFLLSFGTMAFFLHKGVGSGASLEDDMAAAGRQVVLYAAGGPVGFDAVVRNPSVIPHNWQVDHFFLALLKAAGFDVEIPPQHADFINLGPDSLEGNVFTMYFAYLDWGTAGMMLLLFVAGLITTLVFRLALANGGISTLVYSTLFTAMVLSVFGEFFYRGLGSPLRMLLFGWFMYESPKLLKSFRSLMGGAAESYLQDATASAPTS